MIEKLDKLYIDARYPGDLGLLPEGKPSKDEAKKFHEIARKLYEHVNNVLICRDKKREKNN